MAAPAFGQRGVVARPQLMHTLGMRRTIMRWTSLAMQCAIRHPERVRKVVSISAVFRHDGWVKEALDMFPQLTSETLKGSPIETEYRKLSPTPSEFPSFVKRVMPVIVPMVNDFSMQSLESNERTPAYGPEWAGRGEGCMTRTLHWDRGHSFSARPPLLSLCAGRK
jgi:pimeloyl-ACP methyl ester carboxylesterase